MEPKVLINFEKCDQKGGAFTGGLGGGRGAVFWAFFFLAIVVAIRQHTVEDCLVQFLLLLVHVSVGHAAFLFFKALCANSEALCATFEALCATFKASCRMLVL